MGGGAVPVSGELVSEQPGSHTLSVDPTRYCALIGGDSVAADAIKMSKNDSFCAPFLLP